VAREVAKIGAPKKLICKRGHDRIPENLTKGGACKICFLLTGKAWREENRDRYDWRDYHYQRRYGVSHEWYDEMYARQEGRCKICGKKQDVLFVDHDHETLEVRDGLCRSCNGALGLFDDSAEVIASALAYIQRHKGI
jgi:recombination endonuclease VII